MYAVLYHQQMNHWRFIKNGNKDRLLPSTTLCPTSDSNLRKLKTLEVGDSTEINGHKIKRVQ